MRIKTFLTLALGIGPDGGDLLEVCIHCLAGLLGQFEFYWTTRLLLSNCGSVDSISARGHIIDPNDPLLLKTCVDRMCWDEVRSDRFGSFRGATSIYRFASTP